MLYAIIGTMMMLVLCMGVVLVFMNPRPVFLTGLFTIFLRSPPWSIRQRQVPLDLQGKTGTLWEL